MSGHTKKHPTKEKTQTVYPRLYFDFGIEKHVYEGVPFEKVEHLHKLLKTFRNYETSPWRNSFKDILGEVGGEPAYQEAALVVKTCRIENKMTQVVLARFLEVEQGYVSKIEGAKIPIGKKIATRLSRIFNLSYTVFLSDLPKR